MRMPPEYHPNTTRMPKPRLTVMVIRGFRNLEVLGCRLLAAVALQKIHWVNGDGISANVVVVVVHVNLLKSSRNKPTICRWVPTI